MYKEELIKKSGSKILRRIHSFEKSEVQSHGEISKLCFKWNMI